MQSALFLCNNRNDEEEDQQVIDSDCQRKSYSGDYLNTCLRLPSFDQNVLHYKIVLCIYFTILHD